MSAEAAEKPKRKINPLKIAYGHLAKNANKSGFGTGFHFGWVNNGKVIKNKFTGCHADMHGDYFGKSPEAVFSFVPRPAEKLDKAAYKLWIEYLVRRSPWNQVMVKDLDPDFVAEKGVVCPTNVPANFLVNMLIATRMPCEHPDHITQWYKLVKAGAQEDMAMIFACMLHNNKISQHCGNGHHPFDSFEDDMVENWVNHKYGTPNGIYTEQHQYYPCSRSWGNDVKQGYNYGGDNGKVNSYYVTLKKLYPNDSKGEGRMFNVSSGDKGIEHSFAKWIEIINTEHKRLKHVEEAPQEGQGEADGKHRKKAAIGVRKYAVRRERVRAHAPRRVRGG